MKNKNLIASGLAFVLIAAGLLWLGQKPQEKTASAGPNQLEAAESAFDFGAVSMAKGNVSHSFKIKNSSQEPAIITKLYTSCMCTTATLIYNNQRKGPFGMPGQHGGFSPRIRETIDPGKEAEIEVVFDPTAHGPAGVGQIERAVYVEQEGSRPLELTIKAAVTP